ncbi:hypothetical protein ECC17_04335 [Helicobacter pylori]|uniref:hypothetical protein n=1 Tax=Helicobacter pylori TaxID=210 RepID=UPI000FDE96C3|nr:hypothetical protein [Helicobacter pylori]RVY34110.1 hypothetical protein ECC17_04335 [Helicobacter pylori]
MRFFCLFLFFLTFSNAQIMMTFDSQTNAKLSRSNEQLSDMLYKLNESLRIYQSVLSNNQDQLKEIKKANSTLNSQRRFFNASQIRLMDTDALLKQSALELEKLQALEKRLKESMEQERLIKESQTLFLQEHCPYLSGVKNLEEASNALEVQEQNNALFLLKEPKLARLLSRLDLMSALNALCDQVLENEIQDQQSHNKTLEYNALINHDFQAYKAMRLKKFKNKLQSQIQAKEDALKTFLPLEKRLETLKTHFLCDKENLKSCAKELHQRYQNALIERDKELKDAKNNKEKHALILANYEYTLKTLNIEFLSELNKQMAFLNETMALNARVLALLAKQQTKKPSNLSGDLSNGKTLIKNIRLDPHGFPSFENFKRE